MDRVGVLRQQGEPDVVGGQHGTAQRMRIDVADFEILVNTPRPAFFDRHQCNAMPFVSGMNIHMNAPRISATDAVANATPKPRDCASDAMRNGAAALPIRPMLNVKPVAVARTAVGYSSAMIAPKPLK